MRAREPSSRGTVVRGGVRVGYDVYVALDPTTPAAPPIVLLTSWALYYAVRPDLAWANADDAMTADAAEQLPVRHESRDREPVILPFPVQSPSIAAHRRPQRRAA